MHILIIEDEPLVASDLECFLSELGADSCDLVETEDEAIAAALDRAPDLITADCALREGSGVGAVSSIRRSLGHIPVVFITGHPHGCETPDDMTQMLAKPIRWLDLATAVARHNLPPAG
ncbi:response regulator receiver protein [Sphingomonas sp. Root50]|nr:response regulator [Sphingomonas sp. Root50]KQX19220.1 response regulator receiver protein [Sphingomonas sp. Root1294]KQY65422.1 response regulator receiver protein [Sphingomonas sp. Root50]KRB95281.1 response regulator receiver protein [Sphingomonas sp. Root720]